MTFKHLIPLLMAWGLTLAPAFTEAQIQKTATPVESKDAIFFQTNLSYKIALFDMATKYYNTFCVGGKLGYLTKNNWYFSADVEHFFAEEVKIDALSSIRTVDGYILDQFGDIALTAQQERGYFFGASVGKVFPLFKQKRSGLDIECSAGYFTHWVQINDLSKQVPALSTINGVNLADGYDQKRGGIALKQAIGYRYLSPGNYFNFYVGVNFSQAITSSLRNYDFNERKADSKTYLDGQLGFQVAWFIPFYIKKGGKESGRVYY